ncbi:Protein RRP6-like 1 [Picochlorum sp. SENEW3]|nr:Protein RRP6-like 1 [Picochlorum sp. SENEW3]
MGRKPPSGDTKDTNNKIKLAIESSKLPVEEEYYFHSIKPDFIHAVGDIRERAETLLRTIAGSVDVREKVDISDGNAQDVTEYASSVIDALCSETDASISDGLNQKKAAQDASGLSGGKMQDIKKGTSGVQAQTNFVSFMTSTSNEKPQKDFDDPVDNTNEPFVPKFSSLENVKDVDVAAFKREFEEYVKNRQETAQASVSAPHPLRDVLERLPETYSSVQLSAPKEEDVKKPLPIEKVELMYVDTIEELEQVARLLEAEKEIAVDLEAHNYRSFQGFCCLMQLSTRNVDIIVDVLLLRSHVGRLLGPVFADPNIVKVLHGSRSDIGWLQRDFGIYLCNLFDTGEAAKILKYGSNGLAFLLEKHCGFKADKKWQLADWRIRPLQTQAIHYARADTHFLLYCYDVLRIELCRLSKEDLADVDEALLSCPSGSSTPGICAVLEQSRKLCLSLYEKELFTPESFYDLYKRMEGKSGVLSEKQLSVFAAVYAWRDTLSRQLDESPGYILPRGQMFHIARKMPSSKRELEMCLKSKSRVLMSRVDALLYCIDKATKDTSAARAVLHPVQKSTTVAQHEPAVSARDALNTFDMGMTMTFKGFRATSSSSLGSMKKRKHARMVESTFAVESSKNIPAKPTEEKEQEDAAVVEEEKSTEEKSKADDQPNEEEKGLQEEEEKQQDESLEKHLPHGTLDEQDFLPLPVSQLSKKRRKEDQKTSNKSNQRPSSMTKKRHKKTDSAQPQEDASPQQAAFDPDKAVHKYGKAYRPSKKKDRKRGSKDKGGEFEIPTGMFNPHQGLLEGKSSSKRSAVQVRSGNRSSTYARRR